MNSVKTIKNPIKAIREKCIDCSGGSRDEANYCEMQDCPLWPFRMGKNPYRAKREMTEEQKAAAIARLEKARNKKC